MFTGEKSKLYILHKRIIFLNYLILLDTLPYQAQDEPSLVSDSRTCFGRVWFKKYKDVFFNKG